MTGGTKEKETAEVSAYRMGRGGGQLAYTNNNNKLKSKDTSNTFAFLFCSSPRS